MAKNDFGVAVATPRHPMVAPLWADPVICIIRDLFVCIVHVLYNLKQDQLIHSRGYFQCLLLQLINSLFHTGV